uniref:Uncharacterized protein n=1 Tax=Knipowitschia caucasica TaxID=637954 RepID=A0AAV2L020_KNICA
MLELGSQAVTGDHNALGLPGAPAGTECWAMRGSSTPRLLQPPAPDCESWQKHRAGLACGSSYDTIYLPQMPQVVPPSRLGLALDVTPSFDARAGMLGGDGDLAVSPNVMKRRRGGLIEQRDIVRAHQAHKIHSTPQARRKEWE